MHATRYQYGIAMTPERLRDKSRAVMALKTISELRCVAGNHSRYFYDFSPEVIVIRVTEDPAPRLLYCFDTSDGGKTVTAKSLLGRIASKDILVDELTVGVADLNLPVVKDLKECGITNVFGVREAVDNACAAIQGKLSV
jgi:CRISPR-associated protein Cst2